MSTGRCTPMAAPCTASQIRRPTRPVCPPWPTMSPLTADHGTPCWAYSTRSSDLARDERGVGAQASSPAVLLRSGYNSNSSSPLGGEARRGGNDVRIPPSPPPPPAGGGGVGRG